MADAKPTCGAQSLVHDDTLTTILAVFGVIGTLVGIPAAIASLLGMTSVLVTLFGIAITGAAAASAAAAGLAALVVIIVFHVDRCYPKKGQRTCWAGVIEETEDSFGSASDEIFPFSAMHPRVDVVVKCGYWHLVSTNAEFVQCNDDSRASPILRTYYHSKKVCAAGVGAVYGAAVGAAAGIIAGALVAAAIIAAVGCATIILCLLALLLAAIIAIAGVLIGAFVGGQIGKALADDDAPQGTGAGGEKTDLGVGHYVSIRGNLIVSGNDEGAVVGWWAEGTTLHGGPSTNGEGTGGGPPYPHTDPDTNLVPDACPAREPNGPAGSPSSAPIK